MSAAITIREILQDHWDAFTKLYPGDKTRPAVHSEVEKILSCGDPSNGFAMYCCPHCGAYKIVPFRCHSRFGNTCGVAYQSARAEAISSKLFRCHHRHIVFTIAEELRWYFRKDRSLLNVLFRSASQTISDWLYEQNHSRNLQAGMIAGLHTFGRDLKWNPHIHMILTEGALDRHGSQSTFFLIPCSSCGTGFHGCHCEVCDPLHWKTGHGSIRITAYDGTDVTYWYLRHEDNRRITVTEHA